MSGLCLVLKREIPLCIILAVAVASSAPLGEQNVLPNRMNVFVFACWAWAVHCTPKSETMSGQRCEHTALIGLGMTRCID